MAGATTGVCDPLSHWELPLGAATWLRVLIVVASGPAQAAPSPADSDNGFFLLLEEDDPAEEEPLETDAEVPHPTPPPDCLARAPFS